MAKSPQWRNRIIGHDVLPAEDLLANPKNWRIHPQNQQEVMEGVLDEVGWVDEVKVNKNTGFVVDGHMRAAIAISRGESVPVSYLDLTPEEEDFVLTTYNPLAQLAVPDEVNLNDLIGNISTENPTISRFLDGLYNDVNQAVIKKTTDDGEITGDTDAGDASGAKQRPQIRVLMYVEDVATLEQAILRTGQNTRSAALADIARSYIHARSHEEGQQHKRSKGSPKK